MQGQFANSNDQLHEKQMASKLIRIYSNVHIRTFSGTRWRCWQKFILCVYVFAETFVASCDTTY